MKKFILVLLLLTVVVPTFATASGLRCAEGALAGGGLGSLLGGGRGQIAFEVFGALVGCDTATSFEEPRTTVTRRVTVVNSGGYNQYNQHANPAYRYGNNNPCQGHWEGTYYTDGYQRSRQSGGITRDGCRAEYVSNINPAVYTVDEVIEKPIAKVVGPTVYNYTEEKMIHPSCKTENPGADGNCLLGKVPGLRLEQLACDGKTTKTVCPTPKYNPGLWAGIYFRLGKELVAKQIKMQGGEFALQ
ncbi:MAG: hypothetical protein WAV98_03990 [Minisyncoccia bacterium]